MSDHHGANIFVLNGSFEFVMPRRIETIIIGIVLQITFTTLITDGTVQRMICEDKLHDTTTGQSSWFGVGVDSHGWSHLRAA